MRLDLAFRQRYTRTVGRRKESSTRVYAIDVLETVGIFFGRGPV